MRPPNHLGLDLGFSRNPSTLACLEDITRPTGEFDHIYHVEKTVLILRTIFRLPLRTPYANIPVFLATYLERLDARTPHPQLPLDKLHLKLPKQAAPRITAPQPLRPSPSHPAS